jgi:hypothetical protein
MSLVVATKVLSQGFITGPVVLSVYDFGRENNLGFDSVADGLRARSDCAEAEVGTG